MEENNFTVTVQPKTPLDDVKPSKMALVTLSESQTLNVLNSFNAYLEDVQMLKETANCVLNEKQKELNEIRELFTSKISALTDLMKNLTEKTTISNNYEDYLVEKVQNANLMKDVAALQQQLNWEKIEFSNFMNTSKKILEEFSAESTGKIKELKNHDDKFNDSISDFQNKMETAAKEFEDRLVKFTSTTLNDTSREMQYTLNENQSVAKNALNNELQNFSKQCQLYLGSLKETSIDFLQQCLSENKKLIEQNGNVRINEQNKKEILKKNILLFATWGVVLLYAFISLFK
jgi:hypothetical protein